jgi:8-oxo-dGTP pyrophosphatase MutT (NUDIX family)
VHGEYAVTWHASDYAHYLYSLRNRDILNADATGTLFVSVAIPTTDGKLVTGRMSAHTSAAGIVQLPGGGVCIDEGQVEITEEDLLATAVQEVSEELGIELDAKRLRVSGAIQRRSPPDIGIVFAAEPREWGEIQAAFTDLRRREREAGVRSEFDELLAIRSITEAATVPSSAGEIIDYLPAVLDAILTHHGRST